MGATDVLQKYNSLIENKNSIDALSKENFLVKYFSQLSEEDLRNLYKIYEDDFTAFGYEFKYGNLSILDSTLTK